MWPSPWPPLCSDVLGRCGACSHMLVMPNQHFTAAVLCHRSFPSSTPSQTHAFTCTRMHMCSHMQYGLWSGLPRPGLPLQVCRPGQDRAVTDGRLKGEAAAGGSCRQRQRRGISCGMPAMYMGAALPPPVFPGLHLDANARLLTPHASRLRASAMVQWWGILFK